MRQKRMWPVPLVTRRPEAKGENLTPYTSWLNALARSTTDASRQDHSVSA
jgi:hypothetical protein